MIEFRNVSKVYSTGTEAVNNANFTIDKGEFAFLVGSSGSGKSTLIKLILKEEEATSGTIIINGKDTTYLKRSRVPYLRRSMGIVFQDFRLLPDKTVYDNVAYAMYIVRATQRHIRRQVPMVLSLVGLSGKAKMYPNELSRRRTTKSCISTCFSKQSINANCGRAYRKLRPRNSMGNNEFAQRNKHERHNCNSSNTRKRHSRQNEKKSYTHRKRQHSKR